MAQLVDPLTGRPPTRRRTVRFRALLRWLNLTVLQHATWPAIVLLTGAGYSPTAQLSWADIAIRLIGPLAAALVAATQLRGLGLWPADPVTGVIAGQARLLILGVTAMLAGVRVVVGPVEAAVKVIVVGTADVVAFHLIVFGVVGMLFPDRRGLLVILFALSWGLREVILGLVRSEATFALFDLIGGLTAGALIGLGSLLLLRWPGGRWTAPAAHLLVVTLVAGFA